MASERDADQVREQIRAYFPDAVLSESPGLLAGTWNPSADSVVVDFGLSQEFMRPLKAFGRLEADPLIGIIGALSDLAPDDVAVFQVLMQRAGELRGRWNLRGDHPSVRGQ